MNELDERIAFVNGIIKDKISRILEIGPLNRPIVTSTEYPNCFYCDIRSTEQVKELYTSNEYLETTGISIDVDTIVDIDYVLDESYKKTFTNTDKFDYIIASHVMEHMEDIIGFLLDITSVLKTGGRLCIVYPDKRYCFDHFRESASFRDAYDVYIRGSKETARMALDFFNTSIDENSETIFWNEQDINSLIPKKNPQTGIENYHRVLEGQKLDDVHFWPFTDRSFIMFLYDCIRAKILPYSCKQFKPTRENTQQFFVELRYNPDIMTDNQEELENLINIIDIIPLDFYNSRSITLEKSNVELNSQLNEVTAQYEELQKVNNSLLENSNVLIENNKVLIENNHSLSEKNLISDTRIAEMSNTVEILKGQNEAFLNTINEYTDKYVVSEGSRIHLEESNRVLEESNRVLEESNRVLEENNRVLNEQLSALNILYQATQSSLASIENSTSWKITKPIRVILDRFKNIVK